MRILKVRRKDWVVLSVIYIAALIYRIAIVYYFSWDRGPHFENYQIACYILNGQGYWWDWLHTIPPQPTALLPPVYTFFLVIFMYLFNDPFRLIYIAQSFLNALGVIPGFYLGKHLGGRRAGIIAAGSYAFFPEVAITPTKLISEPLFVPLVILGIYLFLKYKSNLGLKSQYWQFFWLGVILGFATLIKTTASLLTLAFFISLLLAKKNRKAHLMALMVCGMGFLLITFPWNLRNLIVMKKPMLFTSNLGYNLWRGNHPWGSGTGRLHSGKESESELPPEYLEYLDKNRPRIEIELDAFYFDEAIKFIKHDPSRYIGLTLKRMLYFMTLDPTHPLTKNVVYLGGYLFVLFFGIWGAMILKIKGRLDSVFLVAPFLAFSFYTPIIILPRYRLTMILVLLILSSLPISGLISKIKEYYSLGRSE
ncbi:MAG: glycosyltransferase family 39 protein [candidate division Zixibacteria bacterium]|nr:glycosyltransferase family 39 protein [candidate division Zixibacteria bacterium]